MANYKSTHDKGECKLYDGTFSNIPPIDVRFVDNDTVKYAVLSSDKVGGNILYLQGNMVKELYKEWEKRLGDFGPSKSRPEISWEESHTLYDVKLTMKQLETLHRLLAWEEDSEFCR